MSTHAFSPTFQPYPFFAPAAQTIPEDVAEAGEPSYALVQSGPAVSSDEVESAHLDAIEVKVTWGTQVLSIAHVEPGESFAVGEGTELAVPEERIGGARFSVVHDGSIHVPAGAVATMGIESFAGPQSFALPSSGVVKMLLGDLTIEISTVRKGKVTPVGFLAGLATGATGFIGLSFLGHAAIVASMAMFMPKMSADDAEQASRDQLLSMRTLMDSAAEREQERIDRPDTKDGATEAAGGGSEGAAHHGESGAAGQSKPVANAGRMAFKGDKALPSIAKTELEYAKTEGFVGMINASMSDLNAPTSPWGTTYAGNEDKSAWGALYGDTIGDAFGSGVGLSGTGLGGGGKADVFGDGMVHMPGMGKGGPQGKFGGLGDKDGMGRGTGLVSGSHKAVAPIMKEVVTTVNGRIPAEVVQRIVRQNFGRFRFCYEDGLKRNPSLSGVVKTKFVIDRNGAVSQASDGGSDLADQAVTSCIVRSFGTLSFPQPEGGITTVIYPISLQPGE